MAAPLLIRTNEGILDLYPNSHNSFYATLQVHNIFSLGTREADYTRILNIPNTPLNKKLFGGLDSHTTIKNEEVEAEIRLDGVPIANKALLSIVDITDDNIEIAIFFGNFNFFSLIPDRGIKFLDFSEYNFFLDVPTMLTLFQQDSGILVAKGSWFDNSGMSQEGLAGINDFANKQDIFTSGFYVYCKTVLSKIIAATGYTLDATDVNTLDLYNNTVLPCVMPEFIQDVVEATVYARVVLDSPKPQIAAGVQVRLQYIVDSDPGGIWDATNDRYVIATDGLYSIEVYYEGDFLADTNLPEGWIRVFVNTGFVDQAVWNSTQNFSGTLRSTLALVAGDIIYVEIFSDANHPNKTSVTSIDESSFIVTTDISTADRNIIVSDHMPDISQRTFLTAFCSLMNIAIKADDLTRVVKLREFNQIADEFPVDYSNNIDVSKEHKGSMVLPNYYRESIVKYRNAESLTRTDLATLILFENDGLQPSGTILTLEFDGLDQTYIYANVCAFTDNYVPAASDKEGLNTTIGTNTFTLDNAADFRRGNYIQAGTETRRIETKTGPTAGTVAGNWIFNNSSADWRLVSFSYQEQPCQIAYVQKSPNPLFDLVDGDFQQSNETNSYLVHFPDTLTTGNIVNSYYMGLFEGLQTPLVLQVWMNFTATELNNINFLTTVYIKEYAAYFYINKIEQWKLNQPCRVTLVRVNKLIDSTITTLNNG